MKNNLSRLGISVTAALCSALVPNDLKATNVLLIIADDQSYPHAGAYGCPWVTTPGFDRIASEGILFNRCYTPNAKSAPSRACLLTGRYSWQLGPLGNHIPEWPDDSYRTLFEALECSGVRTGFTGKGWAPGTVGKWQGKARSLTGRPYQRHLMQNPPTTELGKWDYAANFKQFLDEGGSDGPWIFWMGIREPHRKYQPGTGISLGGRTPGEIDKVPGYWPDNDIVRSDMLDYGYEISYYDTHVVKALELLEEAGIAEDTMVIITSDNGMPFPRRKGNSYECSTHLPLAIMWPAGIRNPGRECDGYVSLVDLAPTILEVMGVNGTETGMQPIEGVSLMPVLKNEGGISRDHLLLGRERHDEARPGNAGYPIRGILRDGYMYLINFDEGLWPAGNPEYGYRDVDSSPTKSLILDGHRAGKFLEFWEMCFGMRPHEELYNVDEDPDCMVNLAGEPEFGAVRRKLEKLLRSELKRTGDPRIKGDGQIFNEYPFYKDYLWNGYEKYMAGDGITDSVFLESDYERRYSDEIHE